jgi:hemoglobin/transferrin/lactoferrin receptor protein
MDSETATEVLSSRGVAGTVRTADFDAVDEARRRRISLERTSQRQGGLFETLVVRLHAQEAETEQTTVEQRITTAGTRTTRVRRDGLLTFEQEKLGGEAQAIRSFGERIPGLLTWGVSASRDRFDQLRDRTDTNLDTGTGMPGALPFPTKYFPESEVTELGAYVQAEINLADGRLKLVPGVRYDRFDLAADEDEVVDYVAKARSEGRTAIVIPFRLYGFGPYAEVLAGQEYLADQRGLLPHVNVTRWIARQAEELKAAPARPTR